jgi:hypothetical protein
MVDSVPFFLGLIVMARKGPYIKDTPRRPKHMVYNGRKIRYIRSKHDVRMAKFDRGLVTAGRGVSIAGRVGSRALPVLGLAMLAYDIYTFAQSLQDKKSLKSPNVYLDPFLFQNITHHDYVQGYNTTPISVWRTM